MLNWPLDIGHPLPPIFEQFSTIVLRTTTLYQDAWIYEHLLISKWQAPLNFPFITEILKLKAKGWQLQYRRHNQQFPRVPLGDRLYRRVRRKLHSLQCFISESSFQFTAWTILYRLTAPGRIAYDTAASLRSGKFHDWELYSFYRLAAHLRNHLDPRLATRWSKRSNLDILTKTTMILLSVNLSWHIPLNQNTTRWLRNHVLRHKEVAIPLHLPTAKLREAAFPRFGNFFTIIDEPKHGGI